MAVEVDPARPGAYLGDHVFGENIMYVIFVLAGGLKRCKSLVD